jgi:hypothetical protein
MRVVILLYPVGSPEALKTIAKGLAEGFQKNGHQVDTVDLKLDDNVRVGIYDYVCFGTNGVSPLSGKTDAGLARRLDNIGSLSGKRCFAFVRKQMLFSEKLLSNLMRAMEAQGMFMRNSAIVQSAEDARLIATGLDLERGQTPS